MKFLTKTIFLLSFIFFTKSTFADTFVYPIQEMSKPECRFQKYSTLGSDCIQDLPILKTKNYEKYKNDYTTYRRIYTVLWGATYDYGWDVGNGGHEGVDIATAEGTPVHVITDGDVIVAGYLAGRGNVVRVKHEVNGNTIYSVYAHLSKIDVSVGDKVDASDIIGEVGSTGNSTGNHLHFEIDLSSETSPWYRTNCNYDYNTIVNGGVCFDELSENTVDPLLFLENKGSIISTVYEDSSSTTSGSGSGNSSSTTLTRTKKTVVTVPEPKTISKDGLITNEEVLRMEIEGFLDKYNIEYNFDNIGNNIKLGVTSNLEITVSSKYKSKDFNGSFPGKMTFEYDENKLNVSPSGILSIDNGIRNIEITGKQSGLQALNVYIGGILVKQLKIGVLNINTGVYPYEAKIEIDDQNVKSDIMGGKLYFNTSEGIELLGLPYAGSYYLTSENKDIKFCIKKADSLDDIETQMESDCNEFSFTHEAYFNYYNTYEGYLVFNYKLTGSSKTKILVNKENGTTIGYASFMPETGKDLSTKDTYYEQINSVSGKGIIAGASRGYYMEDRNLTFLDALAYVRNTLAYQKEFCTTQTCKNTINSKITKLRKYNLDRFSKIELTRYQFAALVRIFITPPSNEYKTISYRDLSTKQNKIINSVFRGNLWLDKYGKSKYFQPDQKITRGEAAYIIYNYITN